MKRLGATVAILAATLGWLAVFFALGPFERASAALDRAFGSLPAWTQVKEMYSDPATQEVTRGEDPLRSFDILEKAWAGHPGAARIILLGNSQTQMTSLSPGEPPPTSPERTYTDLISDHYRETGGAVFYRLSAGALSYPEMLWYASYLVTRPGIKPDVLLVQLNYQNFMNTGIRDGMTSLLSDAAFRARIDGIVAARRPDADDLAAAVAYYEQSRRTRGGAATHESAGERIETAFRERLDRVPGMRSRTEVKGSFVIMLLRARTYFLHAGQNKPRSLTGGHIEAARAALDDLAALCAASGIRMILFQAPTNPAVPLYGGPDDDRSYHRFASSLASRYGLALLDFEHSVPRRDWGMALNAPDPLHLGREGHRLLAADIVAALEKMGI